MMRLVTGTHEEIREFLVHYLEFKLPWHKIVQFSMHLLMCGKCRDWMRKYNDSVKLAQHYLDDPPPDELVNLTLQFLDKELPQSESRAGQSSSR